MRRSIRLRCRDLPTTLITAYKAHYREHSSGAFHWTVFRVPGFTLVPDLDCLWIVPDVPLEPTLGAGHEMFELACAASRAWTFVTSDRTVIGTGESIFDLAPMAGIFVTSQLAVAATCLCPGFVVPQGAVRDEDRSGVERLARECLWLLRVAALDGYLRSLFSSFERAHEGRDGCLVKLFEIVETLRGHPSALAAMPGAKKHIKALATLANDIPIDTSRHVGKFSNLRLMTGQEWGAADTAASALIRAYAKTVIPAP